MALTSQQIVAQACYMAGVPGYLVQAGQQLNVILSELCQTYSLDVARGVTTLQLNIGQTQYALPADYLRADYGDVFFTLNSVTYPLTSIDLSEYDRLSPQLYTSSYPQVYATDMSVQSTTPQIYVWPLSSSAIVLTIRYRRQMPDIATPESSTIIPWFPHTNYLVTRLAGEMMKIADDTRSTEFLGEGASGAQGILDRYLKLKDDSSTRSINLKLDQRSFGSGNYSKLPNTKYSGW